MKFIGFGCVTAALTQFPAPPVMLTVENVLQRNLPPDWNAV
jgi:hypothetical protein